MGRTEHVGKRLPMAPAETRPRGPSFRWPSHPPVSDSLSTLFFRRIVRWHLARRLSPVAEPIRALRRRKGVQRIGQFFPSRPSDVFDKRGQSAWLRRSRNFRGNWPTMRNQAEYTGPEWRTKAEIAEYFQVGVRTVTKLMRRKVLPYCKLRNLLRFDTAACDRAVEFFVIPSRLDGGKKSDPDGCGSRRWRTKPQLAGHFRLSERTVTTLMRQRVFSYAKVGRLVRFDLAECDRAMESFKTRSVVERRLSSQANSAGSSGRVPSSGT